MAATIYDVAKQAGVSTATVSKVLSNTPYVSDRTRAKVLAAVEELRYVPNLAAQGLSKARTFILALVIPYTSDYTFSDPHLLELIRGIDAEASTRNHSLLLSTSGRQEARDSSLQHRPPLRGGYVDGAILIAASMLGARSEELALTSLPCVSVGYHSACGNGNSVHADDLQGAQAATRHLLSLGHRHIGVITAEPLITALNRRLEGHRAALQEAGIQLDPSLLVCGDFSVASGYRAARELLDRKPSPSAIFAFNDRMAMGAIRYLREVGLSVPDDLAVVGFDDIPAASFFDPPLTTVRQPAEEMGATAARMVIDLIENKIDCWPDTILPTELVIRGSSEAQWVNGT